MIFILIIVTIFSLNFSKAIEPIENYNDNLLGDEIKRHESYLMTGGKLDLNDQEKIVNDIIVKHKLKEIEKGIKNPESYAPGLHYFKAKEIIENSEIFKIIKLLPKGSLLHGHSTALVSSQWFIKNITYNPNLMKCTDHNDLIYLTFRQNVTKTYQCKTFVRVSDERENSNNIEEYDKNLEKSFNLYTRYPELEYPDINAVWQKFQNMFQTIGDTIKYLPIFKIFFWRILEEAYEDGIMYLEIRTSIGKVFDESGKTYTIIESAKILQDINDEFKALHHNFIGFKIIYAVARKADAKTLSSKISNFRQLYTQFPNFVVGFDFVGQEDLGLSLHEHINLIKSLPPGVKFFFHAGETNWYGTSIDYNLIDAILLNSTRIGHGYALVKHPVLWNAIKERDIAIEINPLSNQILNLVHDLRNHPAAFYVSEDIPIVISSDDPGFWNSKGLSYDYYYAFMSFSSSEAGLKYLKQLVLNSIKYSIMTTNEKNKAMDIFNNQWSKYLTKIISENNKKIK